MMRIGGFFASMVRICTGLVCVRSTGRVPSGPSREIERVVLLPRRMLGRNVERGEVVEVGLDVRTFGDREAHVGEDLGDLVDDLADRMDAALGQRASRTGSVTSARSLASFAAVRRAGQRLALGLERLARPRSFRR